MSRRDWSQNADDAEGDVASADQASWRRAAPRAVQIAALGVAYFATARLGLSLAPVHGIATMVWPPTGISIAALTLGGLGLWPGVLCGAIAANVSPAVPWWVVLSIGVGNTLEALCGAYLLRRYAVRRLEHLREVLVLALGAAAASPVISATIGVAAAIFADVVPAADTGQTWLAWWLGDALGALIVAPLLLTWGLWREALPRRGETALCLLLMGLTGTMVFGGTASVPPLAYVIFPFVVWSALRLGPAAVSATVFFAAALAINGTMRGAGPFTAGTVFHGLLNVQFFMAVVAVTALTLGAVITERAQAESALQAARAQLQLVTATMSAPVTRCSRDLRYIWVSAPYAEWLGRTPDEIIGHAIVDIVGEEAFASIRPHIDQVLSGERAEYEMEVNFRGLGLRWINAVYVPTFDGTGSVDGWVAVVIDVTRRKALEQSLREEAQRKDEFLAMLAHELRNPLAPIRNAVQVVRLLAPEDARLVQARDVIERQVAHMVRLVDDLLDVSRVNQGKIRLVNEVVDLGDVLTQAIETARPLLERQAHALTVSLAPEPIQIHGDRTRLVQVFGNLLQNAAKFTPACGIVTLTSEYREGSAIVRVRDTGVGLAPESLDRIFDLFFQDAPRLDRTSTGLGIGLTLVQRLVRLHGGDVEARSAGPGLGSEFIVTLPAATRGAVVPRGRPAPIAVGRPLRIYIVEDNLDTAESFILLLQLGGHEIRSVADGLAAVEVTDDFAPDVAFIDLGLPGIDGYEVVRRLRQRAAWRGTVFVALSGYGRDEDKRRSQEAGFDHHLVKPVDPQQIEALLAHLTTWTTTSTETGVRDLL